MVASAARKRCELEEKCGMVHLEVLSDVLEAWEVERDELGLGRLVALDKLVDGLDVSCLYVRDQFDEVLDFRDNHFPILTAKSFHNSLHEVNVEFLAFSR
jgi:hypothetical protein